MTRIASLVAAGLLLASPAYAVTVENSSSNDVKIGVDHGNDEEVLSVAAKKSAKFDCPDGCGVTALWGFSWMAQGDGDIKTDDSSRVSAEG